MGPLPNTAEYLTPYMAGVKAGMEYRDSLGDIATEDLLAMIGGMIRDELYVMSPHFGESQNIVMFGDIPVDSERLTRAVYHVLRVTGVMP